MEENILEQILQAGMRPTDLPLEILRKITNGFSTDRLIGEGGFGKVYKGVLRDGSVVAVKRINSIMTIDEKLFRREVDNLMEVNHQNIVKFIGFCSNTVHTTMKIPESPNYIYVEIRERLLCFEYISNGSLDAHITDELGGLEWDTRYEVIKGICAGLHYLHITKHILHMDLKPANILLDNQMVPKITDFGLSRSIELSQTTSTNFFATPGYSAPENLFGAGNRTEKSDIYSLGTIIIELVTGHKGIPDDIKKIGRRWKHRWNNSARETRLAYQQQLKRCITVGIMCQATEPLERPSISDIMKILVEMDNKNNHIRNGDEPTIGQKNSVFWEDDMLGVDLLELRFADSNRNNKHISSSCSVEVSNNTDDIALNIQATSPLPYLIDPNNNTVPQQSKHSVTMTLLESTQYHHKRCKEQFVARSTKVNEDLVDKDIDQDMFGKGKYVDEVARAVVCEAQLEGPSCILISEEPCKEEYLHMASPKMEYEYDDKPHKFLNEMAQENQDLLIRCIEQHLGFARETPVAACLIYKCLLHWGSFEEERTSVFDRIIRTIEHAVETWDNNESLPYWLSNASTLLVLLQWTLKARSTGMVSATLFGRIAQALRWTPQGVNPDLINENIVIGVETLRQVEAKDPALLFKQQLTTYVGKVYGMCRDNWKEKISPFLGLCMQAPDTLRASLMGGSSRLDRNKAAQQALIAHWQGIVKSLENLLNILKVNNVPPFLVRKIFNQIFSYINVQLLNSIFLGRECCTFSYGEYVKEGLAQLEHWCWIATDEYAGSAWDELKHIRQAVHFLVLHQKRRKTFDEIRHDICPILSIRQLYRISTTYYDDKYGTQSVSDEVISSLGELVAKDAHNYANSSFLLDDDTSIPFSVDDMSKSIEEIDISDIEPPSLLRENPGFVFLFPRTTKGQTWTMARPTRAKKCLYMPTYE